MRDAVPRFLRKDAIVPKTRKLVMTIAAEAGMLRARAATRPETTEKTLIAEAVIIALRKLPDEMSPPAAGMTRRAATRSIPTTFMPRTIVTAVKWL